LKALQLKKPGFEPGIQSVGFQWISLNVTNSILFSSIHFFIRGSVAAARSTTLHVLKLDNANSSASQYPQCVTT
jgi:hypothetical protein